MSQKAQSNLPSQQPLTVQSNQPILTQNNFPQPYTTAYAGGVATATTPLVYPQTVTNYQNTALQGQLVTAPQVRTNIAYGNQYIQQAGQVQTEVVGSYTGQTIKGESRIEYVPFQKEVTEYVTQEVVEYVPREKRVTDYYAVEYTTEYVPQVYQEKYIEYVPVEQLKERVEYQAIQKQTVIQQPTFQENITTQQYIQPTAQTFVGAPTVQTTGYRQYVSGSQFVGAPTVLTGGAQVLPPITTGAQFATRASYYGGATTQVVGAPQVVGGTTTQVYGSTSYLPTTGYSTGYYQPSLIPGQNTLSTTYQGFGFQGGLLQGGGVIPGSVVPGQVRQSNVPQSQLPGQSQLPSQ